MMRMIVPNNDQAARAAAALLGPLSSRCPRLRRDRTGHVQAGQYIINVTETEVGSFKTEMRAAGHDVGILTV